LLTANKKYNPNIHSNHLFYVSWNEKNPKEFRTTFGQKNKLIIFNMLGSLCEEEELVKKLSDKCRNLLVIFDLNTIVTTSPVSGSKSVEYELFLKKSKDPKQQDVIYRTVNKSVARFGLRAQCPNNLVELSLKTYLSYLFLEPQKTSLNVYFNEDRVSFVNLKEVNPYDCQKIAIDEAEIFEGVFYKCNVESKEALVQKENVIPANPVPSSAVSKKGKGPGEEEFNQGILVYYENRLIRRFEAPKMGSLEFLIGNPRLDETDLKNIRLFDYFGYIELKGILKPNLMKTEIENPYYSNYFYYVVAGKLNESENAKSASTVTRRRNEAEPGTGEGDVITKKMKTS